MLVLAELSSCLSERSSENDIISRLSGRPVPGQYMARGGAVPCTDQQAGCCLCLTEKIHRMTSFKIALSNLYQFIRLTIEYLLFGSYFLR